MKRVSIALLAILVALILGACAEPFDIADPSGKVLTYYAPMISAFNGHDYGVFSFNEEGNGGTFEILNFDFDYPTEAAQTAGAVSGKTWFQTDGYRGSFTFDKSTGVVAMTMTHRYFPKEDAATAYQADYEWRTLLAVAQDELSWPSLTTAEMSVSGTIVVNQDNIAPVYFADGDNFTMHIVRTSVYGDNTGATRSVSNMTDTLAVDANAITRTLANDSTSTLTMTGEDPLVGKETIKERSAYNVDGVFEIGGTGTDFSKLWKEGNALTFNLTRTEYSYIQDDAVDAAPTAPIVDAATGIGENDPVGGDYYYIDRNQALATMNLQRGKDYVVSTYQLASANRDVD